MGERADPLVAAAIVATHNSAAKTNTKVGAASVRRRPPPPPAVPGHVAGNATAFGAMMNARRHERAATHGVRQQALAARLHQAVEVDDSPAVEQLLMLGANPNTKSKNGLTALHRAAQLTTCVYRCCDCRQTSNCSQD
eukprot:SAG31_NODE_2562_length_5475_cov_2.364769_3_plen_138_part_00